MRRTGSLPCSRTFLLTLVVIALSLPCNKTPGDDNRIPGIDGIYKGGTLTWNNANGASGSDPNFTFTVTSIDPASIKLDIHTNAPIFSKNFILPLTGKTEANGSGQYTFSMSEHTNTSSKTL